MTPVVQLGQLKKRARVRFSNITCHLSALEAVTNGLSEPQAVEIKHR